MLLAAMALQLFVGAGESLNERYDDDAKPCLASPRSLAGALLGLAACVYVPVGAGPGYGYAPGYGYDAPVPQDQSYYYAPDYCLSRFSAPIAPPSPVLKECRTCCGWN